MQHPTHSDVMQDAEMNDTPASRLKRARELAGYANATDAAKAFGWTVPTYLAHENGSRGFGPDKAMQYAKAYRVTAAWLLTGEGTQPMTPAKARHINKLVESFGSDETIPIPPDASEAPVNRTTAKSLGGVPEIDVRAGMGGGGEALLHYVPDGNGGTIHADDVLGMWELPPDYLQRELRVRPGGARIIEVQGDSMEPLLFSGDRVMVNLRDRAPSPPGVFAVWDGVGVVVKRLELIPNSDPPCIIISSDNPKHRTYERTADEVNIIGRVVWFARRM